MHLPVSFGWYVSGKVGYIGGVQGKGGDVYLGMTDGDTWMGPETPMPGGFANSAVVDLLVCCFSLTLECAAAATSWKLDSQIINNKKG